jgi:CHAT domain-containing protein
LKSNLIVFHTLMIGSQRMVRHLLMGAIACSLVVILSSLPHPSLAQSPSPVSESHVSESHVSDSSIATWMDLGRDRYEAGQIEAAIAAWEEALQLSQRLQVPVQQALAHTYLATAAGDLGQWQIAQSRLNQAQASLEDAVDDPRTAHVYGRIFNSLATLHYHQGQGEAAIEAWEQAADWYAQADDDLGVLATQVSRAQGLQLLGHHRRSRRQLDQALAHLQTFPNSEIKVIGLLNLGNSLLALGNNNEANDVLRESLTTADSLAEDFDRSPIFTALGNVARQRGEVAQALSYYEQAARSETPLTRIEAQINRWHLLLETVTPDAIAQFQDQFPSLQADLQDLPASRRSIYARIHLAQAWLNPLLSAASEAEIAPLLPYRYPIAQLLAESVEQAKTLGDDGSRTLRDRRAQAYAMGQLAQLYEQNQQWSESESLTKRALALSEALDASDLQARWQWQLGRILRARDDRPGAIDAYNSAIVNIQRLRQDLVSIDPEAQFSFRDQVEPIYRELVDLLLTRDSPQAEIPQANLRQAREVVEALQLAELDDFFREACLNTQPVAIDEIDADAATLYPIILPQRLAVILSIPGQPLSYAETAIPQEQVNQSLDELAQLLNPIFPESRRLAVSQRLYDWLIRPLEPQLRQQQPETLVFVLDGKLRNLPMAVLHDGQGYLIERYGLAVAPSLRLLSQGQQGAIAEKTVLMGGLSASRQGFSPLPGVEREVEQISAQLSADVLINETFTTSDLQESFNRGRFSVLHLATHGQFSSDLDETFLVTWDGRLDVNQLTALLQSRDPNLASGIELLVLSACQTAAGDNRAALGLAGFAVRSGAQSTLATLWSVGDLSTAQLMKTFYRILQEQPQLTKAEALRQAQLTLLRSPEYSHPFHWSPFILVGNWL